MKQIFAFLLFVFFTMLTGGVDGQVQFGPKDPLELPMSNKYSVQVLKCKSTEDKEIYGVAYVPNGEEHQKYPLVILSHGYSSSHLFMTDYGIALAESGIACYSFDFCGGSNLSKSEGKTTEMSVLTEKRDMEAVLAASQDWSFVDSHNIFLSGESQGGFVTALAGADRADDIKGMVLLYPAFHIPDAMRDMFPDKQGLQDEMDFPNNMKIGRQYVDDVYGMDAYALTKRFSKAVLILHGDKDVAVPISYAEKAVEEYPSAKLKVIKGAGHVFIVKEQRDEAIGYFIDFVKENTSEN